MENKSILIIGAGALGSVFLENSRGMFKKVGIFDGDIVSKSNLLTQPFYSGCDFSSPISKTSFAVGKMSSLDSSTEYQGYERYFTESDFRIMKEYDIIADFTDNVKSRLTINEGCIREGKPAVFASLNDKEGFLYFYEGNACFNCLFRNSIGRVKEGCESMISAPEKEFITFLMESVSEFVSGGIKGSEIRAFNLANKKILKSTVKRDPECEACARHTSNSLGNGFIQICSSGIKFSYGKGIDLGVLSGRLSGSKLYGEYLVYNKGNKSMLVSLEGDFLFSGYSKSEAEELIHSFLA